MNVVTTLFRLLFTLACLAGSVYEFSIAYQDISVRDALSGLLFLAGGAGAAWIIFSDARHAVLAKRMAMAKGASWATE